MNTPATFVTGDSRESRAPNVMLLDDTEFRWMAAMRRGDFEAAWRETDRLERPRREAERKGSFVWTPRHLLWNGAPFSNRDVVVRCNHGLGDTLQFFRFIPRLARVARNVAVLVQPSLLRLLRGTPGCGDVRDGWAAQLSVKADVEIEIMELAYALRCDAASLVPAVPYLPRAHVERIARPISLPDSGRPRVGILWAASAWDRARSLPMECLHVLMSRVNADFYGLQQDTDGKDWAPAPDGLCDLSHGTREIADLAGAMLQLDLIVTVDCMAAHLAGSLGRPVWLLLKADCDWRWMEDRADSPWYPSARIFRQKAGGDWNPVAEAVNRELKKRIAPAGESSIERR